MPAILVIDAPAAARAQALVDYAFAHRLDRAVLEKIAAGNAPPIGDNPHFVAHFDLGFRVVFTVEKCGQGSYADRWFRHLSASVMTDDPFDRVPSPSAVETLCALFDFDRPLHGCVVWIEDVVPKAVNVVDAIEEGGTRRP